MSKEYHYLIAGLPDLFFDEGKISVSIPEMMDLLEENLTPKDLSLVKLIWEKNDHLNILGKLQQADYKFEPNGNLAEDDIEELISLAKEGSDYSDKASPYILQLISAYLQETPLYENKSWELQAKELFYESACEQKNKFVADWFQFEKNLENVATAFQCKKHEVSVEGQIVGSDELSQKLLKSHARDFGIGDEMPYAEELLKALEIEDILEKEKKIDAIKWAYLEEAMFFHYFTIERIFAFVLRLNIAHRWLSLDKETGLELFNELINSLENSYQIPEEFDLN